MDTNWLFWDIKDFLESRVVSGLDCLGVVLSRVNGYLKGRVVSGK